MGGNYNSFTGQWAGDSAVDGLYVTDMRKTTRPSSSGLLRFLYREREIGDPNNGGSHLFDTNYSLSPGEVLSLPQGHAGEGNPSIWEIWIGAADFRFYRVVSTSGSNVSLTDSPWDGHPLYPDCARRPHGGPGANQYVGAHLVVNGKKFEILAHTTGANWSLAVKDGVKLAEHYKAGDDAVIVPMYSGRDISVWSSRGEHGFEAHYILQRG